MRNKKLLILLVLCLGTLFSAQAEPVVSYLGPQGTYSQEACQVFFGQQGEFLPFESVSKAVQSLVEGKCDYAVIPQENTLGGAVLDYVDVLIAHKEVFVSGEVELLINQNLLALPGAKPSDIKEVFSHKQGIIQGREWLDKNIPDAKVTEVSSTAEGARLVSEKGDSSYAAISSAACAGVYGLEILAPGIQNNNSNKTRFYVLSLKEPTDGPAQRLAFIATGKADNLPALMAEMKKRKMTLITIHDRPRKTELGEYYYLIECTGSYKSYQKLAGKSGFDLRYLGSFDLR
ncbi:MAG: hypothetical protein IJQ86_01625 [Spirochaetia bacterium]|nr:hypothetical protein [Spirochaetia bacterium]